MKKYRYSFDIRATGEEYQVWKRGREYLDCGEEYKVEKRNNHIVYLGCWGRISSLEEGKGISRLWGRIHLKRGKVKTISSFL